MSLPFVFALATLYSYFFSRFLQGGLTRYKVDFAEIAEALDVSSPHVSLLFGPSALTCVRHRRRSGL